MLKSIDRWSTINSSSYFCWPSVSCKNVATDFSCIRQCNSKAGKIRHASCIVVNARRRIRYDEDDEEDDGEEYGNNEDVAMLEYYSESVKEVALLVKAEVDEQDVQILVFKGFSSSLSHSTNPDPSRSILPARAKIKSIDRIKGPFNPSNIEYIDKGLSLETFKSQFLSK
ncbi:hypothetical protein DCAR_0935424 [Daucus carota subsp. sativus]|uniref:DUF7734 domain-containing protein n=2 Tax=Daucus carota subsp. sativus TaxID=79200 RepID=A0A175YGX2_DAUCS|nr:hypothetical protein DCAR_0935424 [Daucus carota subsp. sativus]